MTRPDALRDSAVRSSSCESVAPPRGADPRCRHSGPLPSDDHSGSTNGCCLRLPIGLPACRRCPPRPLGRAFSRPGRRSRRPARDVIAVVVRPRKRAELPHHRGEGPMFCTWRAATHSFSVGSEYHRALPFTLLPRTLQMISICCPLLRLPSTAEPATRQVSDQQAWLAATLPTYVDWACAGIAGSRLPATVTPTAAAATRYLERNMTRTSSSSSPSPYASLQRTPPPADHFGPTVPTSRGRGGTCPAARPLLASYGLAAAQRLVRGWLVPGNFSPRGSSVGDLPSPACPSTPPRTASTAQVRQ